MAFVFNSETYQISMPPGDTGDIWVKIRGYELSDGDVVVFAIVSNGEDILKKCVVVDEDAEYDGTVFYSAHIRLCNQDTRDLRPGTYQWQLRIVTSPDRDPDNNVVAKDPNDCVVSIFSGNSMPTFILERSGARV